MPAAWLHGTGDDPYIHFPTAMTPSSPESNTRRGVTDGPDEDGLGERSVKRQRRDTNDNAPSSVSDYSIDCTPMKETIAPCIVNHLAAI